jgi:crotonobetainyl-CoA:carnitine CoA-transferase CaiB-like acyl-CoA transferase
MGSQKLSGIRVLEVAEYAVAPSGSAVLASWGADVIKIEHPVRGDAIRGIQNDGVGPGKAGLNYLWEPFNYSKRSVGLNFKTAEGYEILEQLIRWADVFICNYREPTRQQNRLDVEHIQKIKPSIIYGRVTAYGTRGALAQSRGYDGLTYWNGSGAGLAARTVDSEYPAPLPGPAFGDIQTGLTLAAGITAALFHRERTGEGGVVDVSLLGTGVWAMSASLVAAELGGWDAPAKFDRTNVRNPLYNVYRTEDGAFIALNMGKADVYWPGVCAAIGRPDLIDDPRFTNMDARSEHRAECVAELDAAFASRSLAEWEKILSEQDGPWGVVLNVGELNRNQQVWDNGYLQLVDYGDGRKLSLCPAPIQFDEMLPAPLRRPPELAEHTEEVMLELGLDWPAITQLKDNGTLA